MAKVIGLGGVFMKSKDPENLSRWYAEMFGLKFDEAIAAELPVTQKDVDSRTYSLISFFPEDTHYTEPSNERYMINLRVDDVRGLLNELRSKGVEILMEPKTVEQGTFAWILDPEGRKVELYQSPEPAR